MNEKTHPHTTAALAVRRAQLLADNRLLRERIRQNEGYIKSLDTAIGLMNPAFDPGTVLPKRRYTRTFERGELKSLVIRILKAANGPLSTEDITAQVMARKVLAEDCRGEVRRALMSYGFVKRVSQDDDHRDYWILERYAAKDEANEGGTPMLRLLRDQ